MPAHRLQTLQIDTTPTLRLGGSGFAGERRIELLAALDDTRSITAAAKVVGLSYKAAWDAVEAMNNLADEPLVARNKGGKGGGGTTLTARGRDLIRTWRAVAEENQRFMQLINARVQNAADLRILGRLTMLTSARNHFTGIVRAISRGAVNDEVVLELSGGDQITAVVTHGSVENLGLKVGTEAVALVKASWVLVGVESRGKRQLKLSARNKLRGTVERLVPGAVNTEVVIALGGGNSVAAIITNASATELALVEGGEALAIFKASSVILGVMV